MGPDVALISTEEPYAAVKVQGYVSLNQNPKWRSTVALIR